MWESHDAAIRILRYSLTTNVLLVILAIFLGGVITFLVRKPVPVLSDERGIVTYHTTEAYVLKPERVQAFIDSTLGKLLTVYPGYYDTSSLQAFVAPDVLKMFNEATVSQAGLRLSKDIRQTFQIYEIKQYKNPDYPQYLDYIVKGERTSYQRETDARTTFTSLKSDVFHWNCYVEQVTPSPDNPWGLRLVGVGPLREDVAKKFWTLADPLAKKPTE